MLRPYKLTFYGVAVSADPTICFAVLNPIWCVRSCGSRITNKMVKKLFTLTFHGRCFIREVLISYILIIMPMAVGSVH